jgi:hypothetical protein
MTLNRFADAFLGAPLQRRAMLFPDRALPARS